MSLAVNGCDVGTSCCVCGARCHHKECDEGSPCWTVVYLTAEEETKEIFTMKKSARMEEHEEQEEEKQKEEQKEEEQD